MIKNCKVFERYPNVQMIKGIRYVKPDMKSFYVEGKMKSRYVAIAREFMQNQKEV